MKSKWHVTKFNINGLTLTPICVVRLLRNAIFSDEFEKWLRDEV